MCVFMFFLFLCFICLFVLFWCLPPPPFQNYIDVIIMHIKRRFIAAGKFQPQILASGHTFQHWLYKLACLSLWVITKNLWADQNPHTIVILFSAFYTLFLLLCLLNTWEFISHVITMIWNIPQKFTFTCACISHVFY